MGGGSPDNWTVPVGCQDSRAVVERLNGQGVQPRILTHGCGQSGWRTTHYRRYLDFCRVVPVTDGQSNGDYGGCSDGCRGNRCQKENRRPGKKDYNRKKI